MGPDQVGESLVAEYNRVVGEFLRECKDLHEPELRPKHHYALHLGLQWLQHSQLADAFVHERKHRLIKAKIELQAGPAENVSAQILTALTCVQAKEMRALGLWEPHFASDSELKLPRMSLRTGQPLLLASECVMLEAFRRRGEVIECLGAVFRRVVQEMPGVLSFEPTSCKAWRQLNSCKWLCPAYWREVDGNLLVLV